MSDGSIIIDTELNDKGLEKGIQSLQSKLEGTGKKLQSVGTDLTKRFTVPLTAAAGFAIKLGMDFEQGMAQVAAMTGATGAELEALETQARDLGKTTQFSALQAAEGMEFLARAGFDTNEIMATMPGMLDLATAASMDLAQAADVTTNIMSGFGLEASEAGRIADVLALASASANTDVAGMGEAMKYVAPVASTLGLSVEDTAAAVGIFADAGIQGGQAGTALRAGLLRLASPTGAAADLMNELGLQVFDAEGNMKSMPEIVRELENGLAGMTREQKTAALETLFGSQAISGWSALVETGSENLGVFTEELYNSEGAAAEMAAIIGDTTAGKLNTMTSALSEVALKIYESLQPALETVIEWVTNLAEWFTELSDESIFWITVIGGIVAAIGPLLTVLGTITIIAGKVMGAIAAINPVVLIVIGVIAALVAIGVALYQNWETIKEKAIEVFTMFEPLFETVRQAFQTVVDFIMDIWNQLVEFWLEYGGMIQEATMNVMGFIQSIIEGAMNAILAVMEFIWPFIEMLIIQTWEAIKNVIQGAIDVILGIVQFFAALFTGNWSEMWEAVKQMLSGAVQAIWGLINLWIVGKVVKLGSTFANLFRNIFTKLWNAIRNIFTNSVGAVRNVVSSGFNAIRSAINTVMNGIRNIISSIWNAIRSVISSVLSGIRSTVSSVWNGIRSTISNVVNSIRSTISNIFNSLRGIVSNAFNAVRNAVRNGINGALNVVTNMAKNFFNAGKNIVTSIADGIKGAIGKVTGAISNVTQKIRDFLPFSPAKEGPLMDLDKLDFEGPISDSLEGAIPDVQAELNTRLAVPRTFQGNRDVQTSASPEATDSGRPLHIENVLEVDGEELARATIDPIDSMLESRVRMKSYMRGGITY